MCVVADIRMCVVADIRHCWCCCCSIRLKYPAVCSRRYPSLLMLLLLPDQRWLEIRAVRRRTHNPLPPSSSGKWRQRPLSSVRIGPHPRPRSPSFRSERGGGLVASPDSPIQGCPDHSPKTEGAVKGSRINLSPEHTHPQAFFPTTPIIPLREGGGGRFLVKQQPYEKE